MYLSTLQQKFDDNHIQQHNNVNHPHAILNHNENPINKIIKDSSNKNNNGEEKYSNSHSQSPSRLLKPNPIKKLMNRHSSYTQSRFKNIS